MRYNGIITLMFLALILLTGAVNAGKYKDKKMWWRNGDIAEELQLTDTQANEIENIFQTYKGKIKKFNKKINSKEKKLQKLVQNSDSTREEVLKASDEINTLKAEGQKLKINMFWEIREVLTPKQRTQLKLIKERYMKGTPENTVFFLDQCPGKGLTFY